MKSVELFAGAGGLALGCELAGFRPVAVVEWDKWACDTIRENQRRDYPLVRDWPLTETDVQYFDWDRIGEGVDLVAGGPPCQPFSVGGKHRAYDDSRDMFPATVAIIRKLQPRAFIIENVKGLTRSSFSNYFQYILLQLEFPEVTRRNGEDWYAHLMRLQAEHTSGRIHGKALTYNVTPTLVNAADYGVPQRRERVFFVGFRHDLQIEWCFPDSSHSFDALLEDQWVTGSYWERHRIPVSKRPDPPARYSSKIKALGSAPKALKRGPWRTVRDALSGLPDPRTAAAKHLQDHRFQPGARAYPGHTGSPWDLPAKTLKAGDHGVPGGENMLVDPDGSVRYFTVRESARLQTFPDGYKFHGSWSETMRQLGNAVPVMLAQHVAASVAERLVVSDIERTRESLKRKRVRA